MFAIRWSAPIATNFLESHAAKERGRNCIVIMDKEYGDLTTGSFRKGSPAKAGAAH